MAEWESRSAELQALRKASEDMNAQLSTESVEKRSAQRALRHTADVLEKTLEENAALSLQCADSRREIEELNAHAEAVHVSVL